jgi:hypothetical protein
MLACDPQDVRLLFRRSIVARDEARRLCDAASALCGVARDLRLDGP